MQLPMVLESQFLSASLFDWAYLFQLPFASVSVSASVSAYSMEWVFPSVSGFDLMCPCSMVYSMASMYPCPSVLMSALLYSMALTFVSTCDLVFAKALPNNHSRVANN